MVISDRALAAGRDWLEVMGSALASGATAVQLRDKEATGGELHEMALGLRALSSRHGALFIVNDRVDVALAAGADGVHLGDDDLPVEVVRRYVPRDFVIGRSADTVDEASAAEAAGADYLGVGSVFGTRTKWEVIGEVIGTERLGRVAAAVSIPVVGIGGVDAGNAGSVVRAGAAGVAVVSAIMSARDPGEATRELLDSMSPMADDR
jgi:thiamine-phosphate pyrophosphorylase